ncbi:RecA family ATPase [Mycena venus]|uniref:RecA family ATPase n=1 Tax=Mycena venus TaxID=2733690 RepID=A0A8H7CU94_9AGAR|nr:RecA family ATPase [Mycena venus]
MSLPAAPSNSSSVPSAAPTPGSARDIYLRIWLGLFSVGPRLVRAPVFIQPCIFLSGLCSAAAAALILSAPIILLKHLQLKLSSRYAKLLNALIYDSCLLYDTHDSLNNHRSINDDWYKQWPNIYDNNVYNCGWNNSGRKYFHGTTGLSYGCYSLALLGIVGGALFWFRRRSRYKNEFDGNFDPARVTSTRPISSDPEMIQNHTGGGTLPRMDLEDDEDDGMGGRLPHSTVGGGIITPFAYTPTAFGLWFDKISKPSCAQWFASAHVAVDTIMPYLSKLRLSVDIIPPAPPSSSGSSGNQYNPRSAKEREAGRSGTFAVANPSAEPSDSRPMSGGYNDQYQSYLRSGPQARRGSQSEYNDRASYPPLSPTVASSGAGGHGVVVHQDGGRLEPETVAEEQADEIPPTYDSLPNDERKYTAAMPPRRAPSTGSVAPSRAESPGPADEDATPYFDTVDELQQHSAAINTVSGVNMTTRRQLLKIKGMSEAKVEKIKEAAHKILGSSFATGVEVQDKRKKVIVISTGSKSVDGILGGGIMSQSISEVYGEFRTGKTQLAHTMSVVAQLPPDLGGASGKVAYIDTEGTFRPDRIKSIADRFWRRWANGSREYTLREHQMELINECSLRFAEDKDFRLLIVDSIMALFRTDYSGRGELSERQQKLAQARLSFMLSKLTKLSEEYNIAILLTNQVQSDPGATMTFVAGGALKPIGGHILSHASATRMFLRKGKSSTNILSLTAHPDVTAPTVPKAKRPYKLDEGGWADV